MSDAERYPRIWSMLDQGMTTRAISDALGVGAGTVDRAKKARPAAEGIAMPPEPEPAVGEDDDADAEQMAAVAGMAAAEGKVAALQAQLLDCERQRRERLAARQSTRDVHERRELAEYDLEVATAEADAAVARLEAASAAVAARDERRRLAAAQDARDEAARVGDELAPQAAQALQAVVEGDGTMNTLVGVARRLVAAELASGRSWDSVVMPPSLTLLAPGARDPWHRSVSALWAAVRAGDVPAALACVAPCRPWQSRDRAEFARDQQKAAARAEEQRLQSLAVAPRPGPGLSVTVRPDWLAEMRLAALRDAGQRAAAGRPVQPGPFGNAPW